MDQTRETTMTQRNIATLATAALFVLFLVAMCTANDAVADHCPSTQTCSGEPNIHQPTLRTICVNGQKRLSYAVEPGAGSYMIFFGPRSFWQPCAGSCSSSIDGRLLLPGDYTAKHCDNNAPPFAPCGAVSLPEDFEPGACGSNAPVPENQA